MIKQKVFLTVLFFHFIGLFWLTRENSQKVILTNSIKVKTIALKNPIVKKAPIVQQSKKPVLQKKIPAKNTQKKPKKTQKSKSIDPFLKTLQEKLSQIKSSQKAFEKDDLFIPSTISFDSEKGVEEDSYKGLLATFFKENLKLPDKGKVKAFLKISNKGKLLECKIISSESSENQYYLKNQLHNLTLPCFNGSEKSYVICFSDV